MGHESRECKKTKGPLLCVNCKIWKVDGDMCHSATDSKESPVLQHKTLEKIKNINYGADHSLIVHDYLKICHVNCQSLFAHFDEFSLYFLTEFFHIICISESWLRAEMDDGLVSLPGYKIFRHDRVGKEGGGVAFYLSSTLHANII